MSMKLAARLVPAIAVVLLTATASAQQHLPPHVALPHVALPHDPHAAAHARGPVPHVEGAQAKAARPAGVAPPPAPSAVKASALAWAKERGFPVREIEVGPPERRVTRLFVPVTTEAWPDFVATFSSGPKRLMLKLKGNDNHVMPVIDGEGFFWARSARKLGFDYLYNMNLMANDGPDAPAMVVELDDAESQHVRQWFTHRDDPKDELWHHTCGHACMDFLGNIEVAPAADGTNTLRPLAKADVLAVTGGDPTGGGVKGGVSTKVPMGKKLFDVLGIARSKDGKNITYNMIHAASDKVQVVGIPVGPNRGGGLTERRVIRENGRVFVRDVKVQGEAIERFEKMTDAELLGPLPPQGVTAVVRPVK
jgi:hypothetical protein